jgi:hypothetical protein
MNEELEKKEWAKPEIVDLDVRETAGGALSSPVENSTGHS